MGHGPTESPVHRSTQINAPASQAHTPRPTHAHPPLSSGPGAQTENFREGSAGPSRSLPGVFFFYDLSPIKVQIREVRPSFLHFVTSVCAIVGGVFTVAGLLDAGVYQGGKIIKKKMQLGKLS